MKTIALFFMMLASGQLAAESSTIYRSYDAEGNPVFSDEPMEDSEAVEIRDVQTVPAEKNLQFEYTKPDNPPGGRYKSLAISSPGDDEAVRANAGNITVDVQLKPALNKTHILRVYLDSAVVKQGRETSFQLDNLERGTHQISAAVFDQEGEEVIRSDAVTFHLLRESNLDPSLAPNPKGPLNPPKPAAPPVSPTNPPKPPPP